MIGLEIKIGSDTELVVAANELRRKVFVDEQGCPADEVIEESSPELIQVVVFNCGIPVATARVITCDGGNYRMGLIAVDKANRGLRLGEMVMRAAIEYVSEHGGENIVLKAQIQAVGFYERIGFVKCGEAENLESGFVLVPMCYRLEKA